MKEANLNNAQSKKLNQPSDYVRNSIYLALAGSFAIGALIMVGPVVFVIAGVASAAFTFAAKTYLQHNTSKFKIGPKLDFEGKAELEESLTKKSNLKVLPRVNLRGNINLFDNYASGKKSSYELRATAYDIKPPTILVSIDLKKLLTDNEMRAVLAHEFTHIGAGHTKIYILNMWLSMTTVFSCAFTSHHQGEVSGLVGVGLLISQSFNRQQEFQADRGATVLGADPLGLITALRKFDMVSEQEFTDINNNDTGRKKKSPPSVRFLLSIAELIFSHPLDKHRFARLTKIAAQNGRSAEEIEDALYGLLDTSALPPLNREKTTKELESLKRTEHPLRREPSDDRRDVSKHIGPRPSDAGHRNNYDL